MYIFLSECNLQEEKEYKIVSTSYLHLRTSILQNNYKYERCKHTKTQSCYKNISCWFVCSFIFFIFLLCGDLKFDLMFFMQPIWWIRTCNIFEKFDQTKMFQTLFLSNLFDSTNLIKLIWPCISSDLSIVDWFK